MTQTPWEREQLEYQDRKDIDSMEGARILGWFGLGLLLVAVAFAIFGCA